MYVYTGTFKEMFRIRFLKYINQKQFISSVLQRQYNVKINCALRNQYSTSINLVQKQKMINSQGIHKENNEKVHNENLTDQEYLVRLKNDPDKFGPPQENEVIDAGDIEEEKYFTEQPSPSQKLRTKQYADIIKALIRQRKIKEAIDVVEVRMLKEDRVKPENYLYNLLLGACGRVGYTQKAFKLYNQMKKRGLKVTGGTYTALFNACANSPWPTKDGLERANHLRNIMIEKGDEPNETNYNVMIKAFGRCGDLTTAFSLVDEMISKGFKVKSDTINFLLQACISDKEAGFRHALLVWRTLVNKEISPSVYTYNLMLRSIRDCGLGDLEVTQDVINKIVSENSEISKQQMLGSAERKLLSCKNDNTNEEVETLNISDSKIATATIESISVSSSDLKNSLNIVDLNKLRPNLMAPVPHLGSIISLSEVNKPEERLLLVGGCSGFLENMKENKCSPDIKTFTQLLDNIPSTLAAEKELMSFMKKLNVRPDIDFYNMLIKKRSLRFDFENARAVLELMKQNKFRPNLITYGVLALSCAKKEEALDLIKEMEEKNYQLNIEILGAMLYQACHSNNFSYVLELMETCTRKGIQPSKRFMAILDEFIKKCKDLERAKELTESKAKRFGILKARHKVWSQEVHVDESEDVHPWQQFKESNVQNTSHYRWKDGVKFKPKHISRFRVKTSKKHLKR